MSVSVDPRAHSQRRWRNSIAERSRLTVGEVAREFGLTHRTLRFYGEKGLIEAERDQRGHRFYGWNARRRLKWITELRRAGLGQRAISEILTAEDESPSATVGLALAKLTAAEHATSERLTAIGEARQQLLALTPSSGS